MPVLHPSGPFPVTCLMVGSVVLTLAPDDHFLLPGNGTGVNGTESDGIVVDVEAMEAQRIMVASSMTVLVGLFQVIIELKIQCKRKTLISHNDLTSSCSY